jgi:hypothetical protein
VTITSPSPSSPTSPRIGQSSGDHARPPVSGFSATQGDVNISKPTSFSREASGESEDPSGVEFSTANPDSYTYPEFASFFTLVEDVRTGTAHNPTVHYIFTDDEGDGLTDTLFRLNSPHSVSAATSRTVTRKITGASSSSETSRNRGPALSAEAGEQGGSSSIPPRERAIVVTLSEDGRSVATAHSLTSDWQVLGADITAAPTLHGDDLEGETGGLMLRVSGTEGIPADVPGNGPGGAADEDVVSLEAAVERYRERMEELRRVVEAGRERS